MNATPSEKQSPSERLIGPAKDFASYAELEYERRRSSDEDFDPDRFREAVDLVLGKLQG
jgi:hypothetical protein